MPWNFIRRSRSYLCVAGVSLLAIATAASAQTRVDDGEQIEFSADQVTYDTENNTIKAVGRVHLNRDGYILDAGEVSYNETTGEIVASGAVVLITPSGDKIYSPRMELKDSLKNAFIEDVRLLMTDGSQVRAISGKKDDASGETSLERAVYSPCKICEGEPGGNPLWQIKAVKVLHNKDKRRLYYTDAVLEVFGVPVLWTPKFSHPDPTVDKASGVLPLDIKTTRNLGFYLGVPYHWVINDSQDLTVTPIVTTKEGLALGAEYRQNVGFGEFDLSGSITHGTLLPNNPDILDAAIALENNRKGIRGHIFSKGEFNHSKRWRSTYRFNWTSDDTYLRRYDISDADTLINEYRLEGFYDRSYLSLRTLA
ncbi:MAG: LPS-assembly protein LptD, partial [Kordiimonas sp.]